MACFYSFTLLRAFLTRDQHYNQLKAKQSISKHIHSITDKNSPHVHHMFIHSGTLVIHSPTYILFNSQATKLQQKQKQKSIFKTQTSNNIKFSIHGIFPFIRMHLHTF